MANSAQARKRARQNIKQRLHNMSLRAAFRTAVKKVTKAIEKSDKVAAESLYRQAVSTMDRIADKGIFHKNKATRHKIRLAARIKAMAS
ncbi:MAG: 30S ribosomal protein S20 [Neisseriales bacterium]|nr:MAG: 30S ribosomal protein S20 [Neisseriales bacterium]